MHTIKLERLISQREIFSIITNLIALINVPIAVWDTQSNFLLGEKRKNFKKQFAVKLGSDVIGWVHGDERASLLASFLSFAAMREYEKKTLTRETLDKYRELVHIYAISEKLSASLASDEIAQLAINEVLKVLNVTSASIMLTGDEQGLFQVIAASGTKNSQKTIQHSDEGIAGRVLKTGKAEIVNDVSSHPQFVKGGNNISSLMCAPLKTKDTTMGVFNVSSQEPHTYSSEDLKFLTSISTQVATALTNAQLYERLSNYSEELRHKNVQFQKEVTERKLSEKALKESEERFRTMAENITNGLIIMEEGTVVYVNKRACEITGYSQEELMNIWGPDLTVLEETDRKDEIINDIQKTGAWPEQIDTWMQRKDGSKCCVNLRFSFSSKAGQQYAGYVVVTDITDRKLAEEKLKDTTEFLNNIIESSQDGIIVSDRKGYLTRINQYFLDKLSYTRKEVMGKHIVDFSPPETGIYELASGGEVEIKRDYIDNQTSMIGVFQEEGRVTNWEAYYCRKDRKLIPIEQNLFYLYDIKGEKIGAVGVLRDITERKKVASQLQKATAFLDNIISSSLDAIVVSDSKGYIQRANRAFFQLLDREENEVLGKQMSQLSVIEEGAYETVYGEKIQIGKDYVDYMMSMLSQFVRDGKIINWESYVVPRDNKVIPVEVNIVTLYNDEGRKEVSVGLVRDITERRKSEKEIAETRDFLQDVFKTSLDGIVVTDASSTITMLNEAAVKIFGYSREELLGKRTQQFLETGDEMETRGKQIQKELMKKGYVYGYEHSWIRKNGTVVDVEISIALLKDKNRKLSGAVLSVRDITQRKQAEKKLIDSQNQLRSLASQLTLTEERERRRIATDLHDRIGQALAISKIKLGALRQSKSSLGLDKDVDEIRNLIEQTIQDTRSLIFDLCPPFLYELGFEKALEWLLEDIQEQHGITTHFTSDGKPKPLEDDVRILLYQSIRELFVNIVKHSQAKNARLTVKRDDHSISLSVEDDGCGFDENATPFHMEKHGGFGLFRIQERFQYLGGEIKIKSKPDQGTKIFLRLPFKGNV